MAASSQGLSTSWPHNLSSQRWFSHMWGSCVTACHSNHYADRDIFWQQSKCQDSQDSSTKVLSQKGLRSWATFLLSSLSGSELTVVLCLSCVGCSSRKRKDVILRKNDGTFSTQRASLELGPHLGVLDAYLCSELHPCRRSFIHRVLLVCSYDMSPKESQVVFLLKPTNATCCSSRLNVWVSCDSFSRIWNQ